MEKLRLLLDKRFVIFVFLGSLLLSFLLYGNTISGGFVYDDDFYSGREELRDPGHLTKLWVESVLPNNKEAGLFRPFSVFTFSLNFILFGESPVSFHLTSILLNTVAVFLVFVLVKNLFGSRNQALFAALLFALLPIHTEAVAYVKARDELLGMVFLILSWLTFIQATGGGKLKIGWLLGSAFLFFLGILSKEFVVVGPALFLIIHWMRTKTSRLSIEAALRMVGIGTFYILPFLMYLQMRSIALPDLSFGKDYIAFIANPLVNASVFERLGTAFKILFIYISKIFVPVNLSAAYHYNSVSLVTNPLTSAQSLTGIVILVVLLGLLFRRSARKSVWGAGIVTFLVLYLPVSHILFPGGDIIAERWMYLPTIGVAVLVGWGLNRLYQYRKEAALVVCAAVAMVYMAIIIPRNLVWQSNLSLFESMVKTAPSSAKAHEMLGHEYLGQGKFDLAGKELRDGMAIYQEYAPLYDLAAGLAYNEGNFELAKISLERALTLDQTYVEGLLNLARVYFVLGEYENSLGAVENIFEMPSPYPRVEDKLLLIMVLSKLGRYQESLEAVGKYLANGLNYPEVRMAMAVNYFRLGQEVEARKYFDAVTGETDEEKLRTIEAY